MERDVELTPACAQAVQQIAMAWMWWLACGLDGPTSSTSCSVGTCSPQPRPTGAPIADLIVFGPPACPACADDHDYVEELIHRPGRD